MKERMISKRRKKKEKRRRMKSGRWGWSMWFVFSKISLHVFVQKPSGESFCRRYLILYLYLFYVCLYITTSFMSASTSVPLLHLPQPLYYIYDSMSVYLPASLYLNLCFHISVSGRCFIRIWQWLRGNQFIPTGTGTVC